MCENTDSTRKVIKVLTCWKFNTLNLMIFEILFSCPLNIRFESKTRYLNCSTTSSQDNILGASWTQVPWLQKVMHQLLVLFDSGSWLSRLKICHWIFYNNPFSVLKTSITGFVSMVDGLLAIPWRPDWLNRQIMNCIPDLSANQTAPRTKLW